MYGTASKDVSIYIISRPIYIPALIANMRTRLWWLTAFWKGHQICKSVLPSFQWSDNNQNWRFERQQNLVLLRSKQFVELIFMSATVTIIGFHSVIGRVEADESCGNLEGSNGFLNHGKINRGTTRTKRFINFYLQAESNVYSNQKN